MKKITNILALAIMAWAPAAFAAEEADLYTNFAQCGTKFQKSFSLKPMMGTGAAAVNINDGVVTYDPKLLTSAAGLKKLKNGIADTCGEPPAAPTLSIEQARTKLAAISSYRAKETQAEETFAAGRKACETHHRHGLDRKSTRLNSSHT